MAKKVNKVIFGNETIMDVSDATAEAADIMEGLTAYGASGEKLVGTRKEKPDTIYANLEIWDYQTIKSTLTNAVIIYEMPSGFIIVYVPTRVITMPVISSMLQFKIPGYLKDSQYNLCIGGSLYISNDTIGRNIQSTKVAVYPRPNYLNSQEIQIYISMCLILIPDELY